MFVKLSSLLCALIVTSAAFAQDVKEPPKAVKDALAVLEKSDAVADAELKVAQVKALTKKIEGRKTAVKSIETAIRGAAVKGDDAALEPLMSAKKDLQAQIADMEAAKAEPVVAPAAKTARLTTDSLAGRWQLRNANPAYAMREVSFNNKGQMTYADWKSPRVERIVGETYILSPRADGATVTLRWVDKDTLRAEIAGRETGETLTRIK